MHVLTFHSRHLPPAARTLARLLAIAALGFALGVGLARLMIAPQDTAVTRSVTMSASP